MVLKIIQIEVDMAVVYVMNLEKTVMAMHRDAATEKFGEAVMPIVVKVGVGIALIVDLTEIEDRDAGEDPPGRVIFFVNGTV